jgi:hypothetical protein
MICDDMLFKQGNLFASVHTTDFCPVSILKTSMHALYILN